jgi:hypothetical protein
VSRRSAPVDDRHTARYVVYTAPIAGADSNKLPP